MPIINYTQPLTINNIRKGQLVKINGEIGYVTALIKKSGGVAVTLSSWFSWLIAHLSDDTGQGNFKYSLNGKPGEIEGVLGKEGGANHGGQHPTNLEIILYKSVPPSWNPYTTKTIKRNFVPPLSNSAGMRLYLNNNRYSTTGAAKGSVGLSAAASRAINRNGR